MRDFLNRTGNRIVPRLLRSPLHGLISRRLMSITFVGRKTGKRYTTSILYMSEGDTLTFFTERCRVWWKNLRDGAPVSVRLRGRDVDGCAFAIIDDEAIRPVFKRMHPLLARLRSAEFIHTVVMVRIEIVDDGNRLSPVRDAP